MQLQDGGAYEAGGTRRSALDQIPGRPRGATGVSPIMTTSNVHPLVNEETACGAFRISPRTLKAWLKRGAPRDVVEGVVQIDMEQIWRWAVNARCRPNLRGKSFFHLTPVKHVPSILSEGLRGEIFVFDDMLVANTIACSQVFTNRYAVFEIDRRGITGAVLPDNVGEYSACHQWVIYQACVRPVHLRHVGTYDTVTEHATEWDYHLYRVLNGWNGRQVDAYFACEVWARREVEEKKRPLGDVFHEKHERLERMLDEFADR